MFLLEGLPTIAAGIAPLFVLADSPAKAKWLAPEEREWLSRRMETERSATTPIGHISFFELIRDKYFLAMALMRSGASATSAVLAAWQPQMLKALHLTNFQVGFINSISYGVTALVMVLWARNSDRTGERRWHAVLPLALAGMSFLGLAVAGGLLVPTVILLTLCLCGGYSFKGPFWAFASQWLSKPTMVAGIAGLAAFMNLIGGGLMVSVVGVVREATGSFTLGMLPIVLITFSGAAVGLLVSRQRRPISVEVAGSPPILKA
jgi:cyanate permease